MLYVNKITNDPQQNIVLTGIPGLTIQMGLRFMPRIQRWIMNLQFGTGPTIINGLAVVSSPNMLRQYRNQLSFGIACVADTGLDPFTLNDFIAQNANLYLLDSTDVEQVETSFYS